MEQKIPEHIKLDERNHVEKPLLDQLAGLGWEVLDLDNKQAPAESYRDNFTDVVMGSVLRSISGDISRQGEMVGGVNAVVYMTKHLS